jgi:hypothetical protein
MARLYAQGDILIERLDDSPISGQILRAADCGAVVVAAGELTGHHHMLYGSVTFYRDDALARDIPDSLYMGHLTVKGGGARLEHEEHAAIVLERGTYRVRRQRQLDPGEDGIIGD